MSRPNGLGRHERLRGREAFARIFDRRCSVSDEWLVLYGHPNGLVHSRIGTAIGKKWGKAHVRNRVRRLYREAFRRTKTQLRSGVDYLLVPRRVEGLRLEHVLESIPVLALRLAEKLQRSFL